MAGDKETFVGRTGQPSYLCDSRRCDYATFVDARVALADEIDPEDISSGKAHNDVEGGRRSCELIDVVGRRW